MRTTRAGFQTKDSKMLAFFVFHFNGSLSLGASADGGLLTQGEVRKSEGLPLVAVITGLGIGRVLQGVGRDFFVGLDRNSLNVGLCVLLNVTLFFEKSNHA